MKFVFVKNKMLFEKLEYERYINCYTSFTTLQILIKLVSI